MKNICFQNHVPYEHISIDTPISIFIDKTIDAEKFHDDFNSQKLSRVVEAMNNENVMNMDILCPWCCSTSLLQSGKVPLDLMFQKILPKVVIDVYSDKSKFKNVSSSWNGYFRTSNSYPDLLLNDEWKIKPSIIIDEEGCNILTCKFHDKGEDKLYCYAPECPHKGNLNSVYSDQLAHCVKIPRISRPTIASKYSTKFAMVQCRTSFSGCDTMNVTTHSDFSFTSELLSIHEDASIIGRPDMTMLLKQKKTSKQISTELADSFIQNAKKRFTKDHLYNCAQGATYVSFSDMIKIQLHESSNEQEIIVIKDDPQLEDNVRIPVKRTWQRIINILQTEDRTGYGTQFRSIPQFVNYKNSSCFTWVVFAIMTSCKELWEVVDSKENPFKTSSWEGWILTAVQQLCFQNNSIIQQSSSPFKKPKSISTIVDKLNALIPIELDSSTRIDGDAFFKFDITCVRKLFEAHEYTKSISIGSSINECVQRIEINNYSDTKIIIIVNNNGPTTENISIGNIQYDLRSICITKSKDVPNNANSFDSIRYMRHGNGFKSWWKQERKIFHVLNIIGI